MQKIMNKFLKELGDKIGEKWLLLPPDRELERIVTLYCNKAYKNKIENELTNQAIVYLRESNHSDIGESFTISGIKVRLIIDEHYYEPKIKAGYYDKGDN